MTGEDVGRAQVFTLAGVAGERGFQDGPALSALFSLPWALCVGPAAREGDAGDALWVTTLPPSSPTTSPPSFPARSRAASDCRLR